MPNPHALRAVLLTLSVLSIGAADNLGDTGAIFARPMVGASGAYLTGRHALRETEMPRAADGLLAALAADPQNPELQQQALLAAIMAGRPGTLALAARAKSSPAAILVLAGDDVHAGRWKSAQTRFASLPAQGLTQVLQPLLLAWSQQGGGATDQALDTLRPYVAGARYRGVFALHAAMICDLAGRPEEAARFYALMGPEFEAPNLRLGMVAASSNARAGRLAQARALIRAMVDSSPDLSIAEPALLQAMTRPQVTDAADGIAEAYLAMAAALQQQDATDFALMLLRLATSLRPDFTPARLLASDIEGGKGQFAAAAATLAPVKPADPLIAVVQFRRASIAERDGRLADASRILQALAHDYPDRPEPWTQLGALQSRAGDYAAAAVSGSNAIERLPRPAPASAWATYYQRGMSYDRIHDWPRAEADFQHALELSPNQAYTLNYLAYAWAEQGRNLPQARQMLERAVELQPNEGSIADSLGYVLLLLGEHAAAVRQLEHAVELSSEDSTINGHLGDAYLAVGRGREAQVQWRRALILNPEPQDERALLAKLATQAAPSGATPATPSGSTPAEPSGAAQATPSGATLATPGGAAQAAQDAGPR